MATKTSSAVFITMIVAGVMSTLSGIYLIIKGYTIDYYLVSILLGPALVWMGYNNYQKLKKEDPNAKD